MKKIFFILVLLNLLTGPAFAKLEVEFKNQDIQIGDISAEWIKQSLKFIYAYYDKTFGFSRDISIEIRLYGKYDGFAD